MPEAKSGVVGREGFQACCLKGLMVCRFRVNEEEEREIEEW